MEKLDKKRELLVQIECARFILDGDIRRGLITTKDIIKAFTKDNFDRLRKVQDYKEQVLSDIVNSPFLLCDQDNLDIDIKKILPSILKLRYDMEIEELYSLSELGDITDEELMEKKEILKFCYYKSSIDGKNILKNGHVKNVIDNVVRSR